MGGAEGGGAGCGEGGGLGGGLGGGIGDGGQGGGEGGLGGGIGDSGEGCGKGGCGTGGGSIDSERDSTPTTPFSTQTAARHFSRMEPWSFIPSPDEGPKEMQTKRSVVDLAMLQD